MNMPLSYINTLYNIAVERGKNEQGKDKEESEDEEEAMEVRR